MVDGVSGADLVSTNNSKQNVFVFNSSLCVLTLGFSLLFEPLETSGLNEKENKTCNMLLVNTIR